jgi:Mn2+/Fe2+ NRAMP family transporter
LTVSITINAAFAVVSSAIFYPNNSDISSISKVYKTLVPLFGMATGVIPLATLLSSEMASSVTVILSGQAIMKDYW